MWNPLELAVACEPILHQLQPFFDISQIEVLDEYVRTSIQNMIGSVSTCCISEELLTHEAA
jgi:hypothetical protein